MGLYSSDGQAGATAGQAMPLMEGSGRRPLLGLHDLEVALLWGPRSI